MDFERLSLLTLSSIIVFESLFDYLIIYLIF